MQKYDDLREMLVTTTELAELGPLVAELKRRADSGDDGTHGLEHIAPPWTCDGAHVALALGPLTPAYRLWRPAICYARGPVNRRAQGPTGGWITVIGIGTRTVSPEALQALRAATHARAWACRHAAVCLDVPDDALYRQVVDTRRVDLYYAENVPSEGHNEEEQQQACEPPAKKTARDCSSA